MQGMSERQYAARVGFSRGAIQKAKAAERLVLYPDGSIDAEALGLNTLICAELLPDIEAMMVRGLNAQIRTEQDG